MKIAETASELIMWAGAVVVFAAFVALVAGICGLVFLMAKYAFLFTSGAL